MSSAVLEKGIESEVVVHDPFYLHPISVRAIYEVIEQQLKWQSEAIERFEAQGNSNAAFAAKQQKLGLKQAFDMISGALKK